MNAVIIILLCLDFAVNTVIVLCCMVLSGMLSEKEEAEYAAYKAKLHNS